jgi:ankyrin repeat protein
MRQGKQQVSAGVKAAVATAAVRYVATGNCIRCNGLQVQPIHLAAFQGNFDCLVWLADNGGALMSRDDKGQLPIHYATLGGHMSLVRAMLEHGVPLNAVNGNGETLLHISAKFGALEMTKMLLDFGADVNAKDQ